MAIKNKNQIVVYSEGSNPTKIIVEILKDNKMGDAFGPNLKRTKELDDIGMSQFFIVDKVAKELADEKISPDGAIEYLQNQLKVPVETAQKILSAIQTRLVPITEKITEEADEEDEELPPIVAALPDSETLPKIESPINVEKKLHGIPTTEISTETPIVSPKKISERKPRIKNIIAEQPETNTTKEKPSNLPKKPDAYREPIE
jgi:hypothetical protein